MLKRRYRFHSRGGVRYTYRQGKTLRTPKLSLVYAVNTRRHQRFAVVVSKKVEKTAVGRNRIRRRLYEAIRLELPTYKLNTDCIFVVFNNSIATMPFSELCALVHHLLEKATRSLAKPQDNS